MKRIIIILLLVFNVKAQLYFYEPFDYDSITDPSSPWTVYSNVPQSSGTIFKWEIKDTVHIKYDGYIQVIPGVYTEHYYTLGRGKFLTSKYVPSYNSPSYAHLILESSPIYIPPSATTPIHLSLIASGSTNQSSSPDTILVQVFDGTTWQTVINLTGLDNNFFGTNWLPTKTTGVYKGFFDADITNYWNPGLKVRILHGHGAFTFQGIDEIAIYSESQAELQAVKAYIAGNKECPFSVGEHPAMVVRNEGPNTAYNIKLYYQFYKDSVPVGPVIMETMDSLPANTDSAYVFNATINTSQPGKYWFKTWLECDAYDYTPFNNTIWSQAYSLYKITSGNYYYEPFDDMTMVDFAREWEGNYESPYHLHLGSNIEGLDTSAWIIHGAAYNYALNMGPSNDFTKPDTGSMLPFRRPEVGKYITIGHYYKYTYHNYVPQTLTLTSPCYLIDSSMGGFMGAYAYHIHSNNIDSFEVSIYDADSDAWYQVNVFHGQQQPSAYSPWKLDAFYTDTTHNIGGYYLPKNKSAMIKLRFKVDRANPVGTYSNNFPVVAIDAVTLGDPPTDIEVASVNVDGCVAGQDSLFIFFKNKYFPLKITDKLPFIYEITVTGPTGTFTYRDTAYSPIPKSISSGNTGLESSFVEGGDLFLMITKPVFDFSVPGTYNYIVKWWHPQDKPNTNFLARYFHYTPNSKTDSINIRYLKTIEPIDFSKWTSPFSRINNFYPSWNSGQFNRRTGRDLPASVFVDEDIKNYSNYPSVMRDFWTFSHNQNNDTCAVMFSSLQFDKSTWLLSEPVSLPLTTSPILLTYDLAMKPKFSSGPNAPIDMGAGQAFSVKMFPECGNYIGKHIDITDTLRMYDRNTVNNTPLATTLRTGLTDTIDISYYSGQKVIVGFNAESENRGNSSKDIFVFLDNINILIPNTDFSPIALANIPDTICPGASITNSSVTIQNYGNADMSPDFKIVYDGKEIVISGNTIINVGNSAVFPLPKMIFSSSGTQTIKVIIATPYDSVATNDTITKTIYITPATYSLIYDSDSLIIGETKCIKIPEGACDGVNWNIPSILNVIAGGSAQDDSVCFTANTADTLAVIKVTRSCNGCSVSHAIPIFLLDKTVNIQTEPVKDIKIYPNPVEETLTVETPGEAIIRVLNLQGQELLKQKVKNKTELSLRAISAGLYLI